MACWMAFSPLSTAGVTLERFSCVCCTPAIWARNCKMLEIWSGSSEATETRNPEESCRSAIPMRFWICCKSLRKISEFGLMLGVIGCSVSAWNHVDHRLGQSGEGVHHFGDRLVARLELQDIDGFGVERYARLILAHALRLGQGLGGHGLIALGLIQLGSDQGGGIPIERCVAGGAEIRGGGVGQSPYRQWYAIGDPVLVDGRQLTGGHVGIDC